MEPEIRMRRPATTLVVHPGSLGDVLLARRALRALKAADPGRELALIAKEAVGRLLQDCGEVDRALPLERGRVADLFADPVRIRPVIRDIAGSCGLAVCWMADPSGERRRALKEAGIPWVVVASPHAPDGAPAHQDQRFLKTIEAVAPDVGAAGPLRLPPAVLRAGRDRLEDASPLDGRPRVIVHPGSGSRYKCCPPTVLAAVLTVLRQRRMAPVLLSGPADAELTEAVHALQPARVPHCDGLALHEVAGVLAAADLYLGHDSGITHLAAAVGVPTVALFGPTDAGRWAPRGGHVRILSGESCRCHGWEEIRECRERACLRPDPERVAAVCEQLVGRGDSCVSRHPSA